MKRTKEDANETRKNIMKAAIKIFSSKGYNKATFVDIAAAANVTRGAVYWHFKSKAELYISLSKEFGHGFVLNEVEKVKNMNELKTMEKIKYILDKYLDMLETNEEFRAMEEIELKMIDTDDIEVSEYLQNELDNLTNPDEKFVMLINEGINKGEFKEDVDAQIFFRIMCSCIVGAELIWVSSKKNYSIKERINEIIEPILNSIKA